MPYIRGIQWQSFIEQPGVIDRPWRSLFKKCRGFLVFKDFAGGHLNQGILLIVSLSAGTMEFFSSNSF
jgi:hypothetical protein